MDPTEVARTAITVASEHQAEDIVLLDIRKVAGFTDFFVIMSAESRRQLKALQEELEEALEQAGASLHHREGSAEAGWILLDFSDVIIHIFGVEEREYYGLDELWSEATQVVRVL